MSTKYKVSEESRSHRAEIAPPPQTGGGDSDGDRNEEN